MSHFLFVVIRKIDGTLRLCSSVACNIVEKAKFESIGAIGGSSRGWATPRHFFLLILES